MAVSQNLKETGWFYHAPAKPKTKFEPTELPPASQIPGLSDIVIDPNEHMKEISKRFEIKESDSKYIKLAKTGGRPDLLRFKPFTAKTNDATPYHRNEWFYLEDNRAEDEDHKQNDHWDFRLPEYMVHEPFRAEEQDQTSTHKPARYPYGRGDNTTVFQREGHAATDKTVKIPEQRQHGFGYRQEKMKGRPVKGNLQPRDKIIKPAGELETKPRYVAMPTLDCELEKPKMGKILSYNYASEWHSDAKKWRQKQDNLTQKPTRSEPLVTEYQENINKVATGLRQKPKQTRNPPTKPVQESTSKTKEPTVQEKDIFKLSRFKNVHSKVDSHRANGGMPAVA